MASEQAKDRVVAGLRALADRLESGEVYLQHATSEATPFMVEDRNEWRGVLSGQNRLTVRYFDPNEARRGREQLTQSWMSENEVRHWEGMKRREHS